jgi:hypothetical protein
VIAGYPRAAAAGDPASRPRRPALPTWVAIALVAVAWAAYQGAVAWQEARAFPIHGDHVVITTMVLKQANPELFSRDYVYKDDSYFSFYTPSFRILIQFLTTHLGSPGVAFAAITPLVTLLYVCSMTALGYLVSRNAYVALSVAVFSSLRFYPLGGEVWGTVTLSLAIPRTLFTAVSPLLLAVLMNGRAYSTRHFLLAGFMTGAGANLHPSSAFHLLQCLTMAALIVGTTTPARRLVTLLALPVVAAVGASPMLTSFLQGGRNSSLPNVEFELFHGVFVMMQKYMYPFTSDTGYSPVVIVSATIVYALACSILIIVLMSGVLERRRHAVVASLLLCQLPFCYLIVGSYGQLIGSGLVVAAGAYVVLLFKRRAIDHVDELAVALLTGAVSATFVGSFVVGTAWRTWELWALSPVVAEQGRASRWVYLPLLVILSRLVGAALRSADVKKQLWATVGFLGLLAGAVFVRDWVVYGVGRLTPAKVHAAELADWARSATPTDSLFYFDAPDFRMRAERSITHSLNDVGLAAYGARSLLVPFWERYSRLEGAYADPLELVKTSREFDADYVVVRGDRARPTGLAPVFENGSYAVYPVPPG